MSWNNHNEKPLMDEFILTYISRGIRPAWWGNMEAIGRTYFLPTRLYLPLTFSIVLLTCGSIFQMPELWESFLTQATMTQERYLGSQKENSCYLSCSPLLMHHISPEVSYLIPVSIRGALKHLTLPLAATYVEKGLRPVISILESHRVSKWIFWKCVWKMEKKNKTLVPWRGSRREAK